MKLPFRLVLIMTFFSCTSNSQNLPVKAVTDEYHGQKVVDPYRYIENIKDSLVINWIDARNDEFESIITGVGKETFIEEQLNAFEHEKSFKLNRIHVSSNDNYFYTKQKPDENVAKLYYRATFEGEETLLFDPETFRKDKQQKAVINYIKPDWNGEKIVVSLTEKGKEIAQLIIIDVRTKKIAPKIISDAMPSMAGGIHWLPDNTGFIYSRPGILGSKNIITNTQSVLYTLGDDPSQFKVLLSIKNNPGLDLVPEDFPGVYIPDQKSPYSIAKIDGANSYKDYYYMPITALGSKNWKPIFKKTDQIKYFDIKGDSLFYRTSKEAPNFRICKTSLRNPNFENPEVLVKEKKDEVITDFEVTKTGVFFVRNKNGVSARLYKLNGQIETEIKLPKPYGEISLSSKGVSYPELGVEASGWISENQRFEYHHGQLVSKNLNPNTESSWVKDMIIEEIEVKGHDGELIPLSLIYQKGVKRDGTSRVMMDGYGAYGFSRTPAISAPRLLWVKEGGIYAVAHVRGGGEKGDAWHKGGYKQTKPNTWKDFISCAEYLIDQKYTSNHKLAVWSGSAGGILIGRAITERPDLFKAAIVEFGGMNMLRFEGNHPNGMNSAKEFGSIKDPDEFKALLEMDPYHHIEEGKEYPSILLTAGLNDPRLPSWFSIKFAARMRNVKSSKNPVLLKIDKDAGHGRGIAKDKTYERYSDILAFALWQTGHPEYQPKK